MKTGFHRANDYASGHLGRQIKLRGFVLKKAHRVCGRFPPLHCSNEG
jgi:hypothetical protein